MCLCVCERSEHCDTKIEWISTILMITLPLIQKQNRLRRPGNRNPKGKCRKAKTTSEIQNIRFDVCPNLVSDTKIEYPRYYWLHCISSKSKIVAPTGNRTQGKCLEGIYVTTTPSALAIKWWQKIHYVKHINVNYICHLNLTHAIELTCPCQSWPISAILYMRGKEVFSLLHICLSLSWLVLSLNWYSAVTNLIICFLYCTIHHHCSIP